MKIYLSALQEGVEKTVEESYVASQLDLETVDLKFSERVSLKGTALRERSVLRFWGHIESRVRHVCGRCLKEKEEELRIPFDLFYEVGETEFIDTVDDLRETVLIDQPMTYVCREECKGLCPNCGVDLNESQCGCHENEGSGPLSDLKKLRNRMKEE